jgi:hypothetical protein
MPYCHIAVCYLPAGTEFVEGSSLPHVTLRKGEFDGDFPDIVAAVEDQVPDLARLSPDEFVCTPHGWHPDWWAADNFIEAHTHLLDKVPLAEKIPRWLWRDSKKSDNPEEFILDCKRAVEAHGTPWDGETRFRRIAHMTKVDGTTSEGEALKRAAIAVFDGKSDKGKLLFETPHVLFKIN